MEGVDSGQTRKDGVLVYLLGGLRYMVGLGIWQWAWCCVSGSDFWVIGWVVWLAYLVENHKD